MAGEEPVLTGWRAYFNTVTIAGRRNVSASIVSIDFSDKFLFIVCLRYLGNSLCSILSLQAKKEV